MLITILSGPVEGQKMNLLYKTIADCQKATAVVSHTFAGAYDHKLECVESDTPSGSIRPRTRP
jgi:uncharacterized protein YgiB involved in biofilm formation